MYNAIISIIANFFRVLITKRFYELFFPKKEIEKVWEWGSYTLFFIATSAFYFIFRDPIVNLVINILGLGLLTLLYEADIKKKVFLVILLYSINMVCDTISAFSFANISLGQGINQMFEIVTTLLILISQLLVEKIIGKQKQNGYLPPHWNILFLVPVASIIMLYFLLYGKIENQATVVAVGLGILIINIITFYLYNTLLEDFLEKQEREMYGQQINFYENQLEIIMESDMKIRALQHDLNHHLKELTALAKESENTEILSYLEEMHDFANNEKEHVYSKNKAVDSLLNYMLQKAQNLLNQVDTKILIPEKMDLHSFDLNVLLGNLLENAIEAASQSEEKYLNFFMRYEKGVLGIVIENSYKNPPQKENNVYLSSKEDKENHGIGLANVERVVKKHNGIMQIDDSNYKFKVNMLIYI